MAVQKKIAFLSKPFHKGGVTRWMVDAAVYMSNTGYEVYFLAVEPKYEFVIGKAKETAMKLLADEQHKVHIVKKMVGHSFEFGTPGYITEVYRDLLKQLEPGTPVIIADYDLIWKAAASLANTYPMIGVLHGDYGYYYDISKKYAENLSVVAGVSGRIRDRFVQLNPGFDPNHAVAIPCGTVLPEFRPLNERNDNVIKLIFIGRFEAPEKRVKDLVSIAAVLHARGIAFHMDIVGNLPESEKKFSQLFKDQSLDQFISFRGWQTRKEIENLLFDCDILLLNSEYEGMPIVLMEALSCGCGFVGTRVSGVEDYEFHPLAPDCIGVYTMGDFDDAVNKIQKVAAVPKSTRYRSARKIAEAEFSIQICTDRYVAAINSLDKQPKPTVKFQFGLKDRLKSNLLSLARHVKLRYLKR